MHYSCNQLLNNNIQIYGGINGIAISHKYQCVTAYHLHINFFQGNRLIKVQTSEQDNTMRTISAIKARIDKIVHEEQSNEIPIEF